MPKSAPQVFNGITPENYATLLKKAQASGFNLSGNSGSASKFGVAVVWNYSPEGQQLTIQCMGTPFLVKPKEVDAKIQALVKETVS